MAKKIFFWERIAFRISLGFALPIFVSAFALYSVSSVFSEVSEQKERSSRMWAGIHLNESKALLVLAKLRLHVQLYVADGGQERARILEGGLKAFQFEVESSRKNTEQLSASTGLPLDIQLIKFYNMVNETHKQLIQSVGRLTDPLHGPSPAEAQVIRREIDRMVSETESVFAKLHAQNDLFEQKLSVRAEEEEARTNRTLNFYLIAVFFIGMATAIMVSVSITSPIHRILARIQDIATGDGDLTKRVSTRAGGEMSELAQWLNVFLDKTHSIIATLANASSVVRKTTDEVGEHINKMTVATAAINHSMMEQSMNIDESTSRVGSIDDLIQNSGESTRQAASLSKIAMDRALQGGASVHETVEAMEKIEESARKVEELVSSINEIASQTNLLAINAAIEATKAGDHGKGFAVVAEEVRKLAERARKLTSEVTGLIGESSGRVKAGVGLARAAGTSLDGIIKDVEAVSSLIQRVAAASAKQTESSTVVLEFMQKVSQAVRDNLTEMENVTHATEFTSNEVQKLDALVDQLNELVGQFRLESQNGGNRVAHGEEQSADGAPSGSGTDPGNFGLESVKIPAEDCTPAMNVLFRGSPPNSLPSFGSPAGLSRPNGGALPGLPSLPPGASPVDPSDEGGHEDVA